MSRENEELKKLDDKELLTRLSEAKRELIRLNAQRYIGNLKNPMALRNTRKLIARINTILRLRQEGKV